MKKNSTGQRGTKARSQKQERLTIGVDLGDKTSQCCALNGEGEVLFERRIATSKKGMAQMFGALGKCRVALEVGSHSPWVSRLLASFGHEVIVANARQLQLIVQSTRKDDKLDARTLARLARIDPELLRPIRHRSEQAQLDLTRIRVRAALVEARTALINTARGLAKALGERLPKCSAAYLTVDEIGTLPETMRSVLEPVLRQIESLSEQIHACDKELEQIARKQYPETELLRQISGVGTLIALTYVLTVEDPARFRKSRQAGCYVGLRPKRRDSGESRPQLGISKEGDSYLRTLLVQGAHCILKQNAPDTDLKRWGLRLAARGGKNARKRAVTAVARKLVVLLHCLWVTGAVYQPLRNGQAQAQVKSKAA